MMSRIYNTTEIMWINNNNDLERRDQQLELKGSPDNVFSEGLRTLWSFTQSLISQHKLTSDQ